MIDSIVSPIRTVIVDGQAIDYHWQYGRVTLTWKNVLPEWEMATGLVRIHDDENNVPGNWHSCVTVMVTNGVYELELYVGEKPYGPGKHEFKAFYNYLEGELGLVKKGHIRAKTGRKPRLVPKHEKVTC